MKLLITLLLILSSLIGNSQSNEFCVSVNKSNAKNGNTVEYKGFGCSIKHHIYVEKNLHLLFGLEYNYTNMMIKKIIIDSITNNYNVHFNLHYMMFPVSVRYNYGNRFKVFVETGGYLDLLIDANRYGLFKNNKTTTIFSDNIGFPPFNVGIFFGGGCKYVIYKQHELLIKYEYKYGFMDMGENTNDLHNKYHQLNLGFSF